MKVFISYASEDERKAKEVKYALAQEGHDVFLGSGGLAPGQEYHQPLREEVNSSDLFIFLISPESVARGRYTQTELRYAKAKWPAPKGAVLPVVLDSRAVKSADPYLAAATLFEVAGNVAAEVADHVSRMVLGPPVCDVLLDTAHGQGTWRGIPPRLAMGYASASQAVSKELGLSMAELPEGAILAGASLDRVRALVLPTAPRGRARFEPEEIEVIRNLIGRGAGGAGLLVLGTYNGDWHHEANLNEILEPYGIEFETTNVVAAGESATGHFYKANPDDRHAFDALSPQSISGAAASLLDGVERVRMLTACTIADLGDGATPLLVASTADVYEPQPAGRGVAIDRYNLTTRTPPAVVAAVSRVAKVAAIGSWKLFLDPFLERSESARRFWINLVRWLSSEER